MILLDWFDKRRKQQNDSAVAEMLKQQAQDRRPLHVRLQEELDGNPEGSLIIVSKAMLAEAIAALA